MNETVLVNREKTESVIANIGNDLLAVGNQRRIVQARRGGGRARDRHCILAVGAQFLQQIRTSDRKAAANSGHAINLGEGAQNNNVLIRLHLVYATLRV